MRRRGCNASKNMRTCNLTLVFVSMGLWATSVLPQAASPTNIYSTSFEAAEGYRTDLRLAGQNGWLGIGSGGGWGGDKFLFHSPPYAFFRLLLPTKKGDFP